METELTTGLPMTCPVIDPYRKLGHLESALESIEWQAVELFLNEDPAIRAEAREIVQAFAVWMLKLSLLVRK
jgi:hypothetical protein